MRFVRVRTDGVARGGARGRTGGASRDGRGTTGERTTGGCLRGGEGDGGGGQGDGGGGQGDGGGGQGEGGGGPRRKAEEAKARTAEEAKAKAEEAKADAEAEAEATAEETRSKASASEAEASAATAVSSLSVRVDALAEAVGDELLPQMRRFDERVAAVEAKEKTSPTSPTSNSDASTTSIAEKALLEATRAGNIADAALKRVNLDTRGIESLGDRVSRVERRVADAASDVDALRDDVEKGDAALANVLRSEMESAREDTRELEATARRTAEEVRHLSARGFGGGGIGIGDAGDAGTAEEDARGSFRLRSLFRRRVEETDARSPGNATRATEETPRRRDAR